MEIKDFGSHNLNTTGGKVPDTVYFYNKCLAQISAGGG